MASHAAQITPLSLKELSRRLSEFLFNLWTGLWLGVLFIVVAIVWPVTLALYALWLRRACPRDKDAMFWSRIGIAVGGLCIIYTCAAVSLFMAHGLSAWLSVLLLGAPYAAGFACTTSGLFLLFVAIVLSEDD